MIRMAIAKSDDGRSRIVAADDTAGSTVNFGDGGCHRRNWRGSSGSDSHGQVASAIAAAFSALVIFDTGLLISIFIRHLVSLREEK